MYCSNCGAGASGNFCAACGASLVAAGAPAMTGVPAAAVASAAMAGPTVIEAPAPRLPEADPVGWESDVRYAVIVSVPTVRDRMAANAARSKAPITGEKLLELADKVYKPIPGISMTTVVEIISPIYARKGIKTGKERAQAVAKPVGWVLADVLCLLALNGYTVRTVHQGSDGCVLECDLPSDWRSFAGGQILVTVERYGTGAGVKAVTNIPGQLYDWGKSKQALDRIFTGL